MGSKKKLNYGEDLNSEYKSNGVRGEKKTKKRSSRHNAKVMKPLHWLVVSLA